MNRNLLVQMLTCFVPGTFRIVEGVDGVEAVEIARRERPDLILLDLSLPKKDGWSAAREMKDDAATRGIPVVAVSAHTMIGDRESALASGCDDFLSKPIDKDELRRVVGRWIGRPERA
ncbi:MAG: response regulator [Nitrospirae bacterium]|nr:response regulator [Nitrospirota bacterium]MBI3392921.1 response regulator [Nitrospirota bacterium]